MQREFDRLFNDFSGLQPFTLDEQIGEFYPRINVADVDEKIEISVELPGMEEDDIELTLKKDLLTIRGEKNVESEEEEGRYYRRERRYGSFCRTIRLPEDEIDVEKVEAKFTNGVLTITLPKVEEEIEVLKKITVQAG